MMNLKYYLRGLGIGVVVTALIMGITAGRGKESLSNEEIKERARKLGMAEQSTVLADTLVSQGQEREEVPPPNGQDETLPEPESEPVNTGESDGVPESEGAGSDEMPESAETEGIEPAAELKAQTVGPVSVSENEEGNFTIEIKSGDSSYSICQKLEDAGLVETATAFDRYLFENGYDKRINTGVFEIPAGADMEEIAKILARMK